MNVCEEAMDVVLNRQASYGTPESNFATIASMWNSYLAARPGGRSAPITPSDVAMMMIAMKVARHANRPKRDNIVDIAGYALTAEQVDASIQDPPTVETLLPPPAAPSTFAEMYEATKKEFEEERSSRGLPIVGIGR